MAASTKVARLTTLALFSPTPSPSGPKPTRHSARSRAPPPISISMDPALVDPAHLQALMLACAHSCALRLSPPPPSSPPEPVDLAKLRTALAHSFIVVSVFCGARFLTDAEEGDGQRFLGLGVDLGLGRQGERRLVGFGRAVSDLGLTASVHDVVLELYLIVLCWKNICRVLHSRGIYDISALCTEKERPFFEACGFGDDMMGSTTMLYTRNGHK
ncbi:hypothetical protein BAE44_0003089 [Dichanthelium oligosanthes]|uniref:Uncharacterized protein n=1 Tax=Dichanthelium oligosanthes TaxID=888268 RepID=A0A1E5WER1_9POAL|nr:hypothetical protein BAE44_0003089 [Dichanthelium oligosanthes]